MLSIGELASLGRVSVRMLRHYDEIGLLRPARVDPVTGYRSYTEDQTRTLTAIVRFRGFGLGLEDIGRLLDADTESAETIGVLESARASLVQEHADVRRRLEALDAYLREARGEHDMDNDIDTTYEAVPARRIAALVGTAPGFGPEHVGPVVGPLFGQVAQRLEEVGIGVGLPVAYYVADEAGTGDGMLATAGFDVDADVEVDGLRTVDLPAIDRAATTLHRGPVSRIADTWERLLERLEADGWTVDAPCREEYLVSGDVPDEDWVTRLVQPVRRSA